MISFWEKDALLNYDYVIVGAGILGLSTAIEIKESTPNARVLVLERGIFPTGASTKNAGFACFAKACEMLGDIKLQGAQRTAELAYERFLGLNKLRARIGDEAMNFIQLGGNELIFEGEQSLSKSDLSDLNGLLSPLFKQPVFEDKSQNIAQFGFGNTKQLIFNSLEGQIHSGKMISALWELASRLGVRIMTGTEVKNIEESNQGIEIEIYHSILKESLQLKASKVAVCTNALANDLLPENTRKTEPGRGQVLVTKPIDQLPFKGTFHFDEGYYYFRNYEDRILFGGGRNLAKEEENTSEFAYNQKIQDKLDSLLEEVILPKQRVEIDMKWTGIMGFSEDKTPRIESISDHLFLGFTCNGMGIALGSLSAEKLAKLMQN